MTLLSSFHPSKFDWTKQLIITLLSWQPVLLKYCSCSHQSIRQTDRETGAVTRSSSVICFYKLVCSWCPQLEKFHQFFWQKVGKKKKKKSPHFFFYSLTATVTELIWKYCFLNHWAAVHRSSLLTFWPSHPSEIRLQRNLKAFYKSFFYTS